MNANDATANMTPELQAALAAGRIKLEYRDESSED